MPVAPSAEKTAKITIEAEPDLVEAINQAIDRVLIITYVGRKNRVSLSPDKVRCVIRAHPRETGR